MAVPVCLEAVVVTVVEEACCAVTEDVGVTVVWGVSVVRAVTLGLGATAGLEAMVAQALLISAALEGQVVPGVTAARRSRGTPETAAMAAPVAVARTRPMA